MIHPKTLLTIAAIAAFPVFVIFSKDSFSNHKNGAFIDIESKADGFWEQSTSSWTLSKNSDSKSLSLAKDVFYNVPFTIDVGKSSQTQSESKGANGEACVKNKGDQTTENLIIENQIQYGTWTGFKDLAGAKQTINNTQAEAGKTTCIPYKIAFTPPSGANRFRVKSQASITNSPKKQGENKPTSDTDGFRLPPNPQPNQDTATITDSISCPQNFTCAPSDVGPWNTSGARTINYSVLITNVADNCALPTSLNNTATLTENTTQKTMSSTNIIPINNGGC